MGTHSPADGILAMLLFVKPSRLARALRAGDVLLTAVCILGAGAGTFAIDFYLACQREARCAAANAMSPPADLPGGPANMMMGLEWLNPQKFRAGTPAPDFSLSTALDHRQVQLADFRGRKPVVLLFGSFGCNLFCNDLDRLSEIGRNYPKDAEFLLVYVSDAPHAVLPAFKGSPPESRPARIQRGLRYFGLVMSCLIDGSDRAVEKAYDCMPRRLVVVDRAGNIALDLGKGLQTPWNLDELEQWLKTHATP
jgi:hypothetical protein